VTSLLILVVRAAICCQTPPYLKASLCHVYDFTANFYRFRRALRPSSTSRLISKALSYDTLQELTGALPVLNSESGAIVVAEVELRQVAVQMLAAAMLVNAVHAAA
jgi:hypothetical protein